MSFVRTLATLAAGFAAAKGFDKYQQMGGMAGVQEMMKRAGDPGGPVDQMAQMADRMGIPGGGDTLKQMYAHFGRNTTGAAEAAQAGFGGLMAAMQSSAASGARNMGEMVAAMTEGTPASAAMEANAQLMIRAMIQAAKADGEVDPEERAQIMAHLSDASPEEIAFVEKEFDAPLDLGALATDAGEAMKSQVYSTSLMVVKADNPAEIAYLQQLSTALGLDPATRDAIHASMGLPPLPG